MVTGYGQHWFTDEATYIFYVQTNLKLRDMVMVFHATFNKISLISCRKPEYTEKTTDLPQETPYTYIQRSLLFPCHVCRWPFVIRWWFSFIQPILDIWLRAMVMVFNDTFNNISVTSILWRSVLLVEETGLPRESYRPVACHWQTLSHNIVSNTPRHNRDSNSHL